MRWMVTTFVLFGILTPRSWSEDTPPRSLDVRVRIELFATLPRTGVPTSIDVDELGRVWVVEGHSHQGAQVRAELPADRILVMSDTDGDGKADRTDVFVNNLDDATSVAVRPAWMPTKTSDGKPRRSVYVATRDALWLLHDDDGDNQADHREVIVRAQVEGLDRHLGFNGLAFDPLGDLYFGFSAGLNQDHQLVGADQQTYQVRMGDGGSLFRTRGNGTQLSRVATGFCHPQAVCCDGFGRFLAVDRRGDDHRLGRLLHVIPGGDYGYRSRNGRHGGHPFTSWNGEIPGTLPMVASTGLSPAGIVAYESDGLPEDYLGNLLVPSHEDHRIDRFRLNSRGTSFASSAESMIVGDESFRPVGVACAPDGSLFCSDMGTSNEGPIDQGRIWMITAMEPYTRRPTTVDVESMASDDLSNTLTDRRLFARRLAARKWVRNREITATSIDLPHLQNESRSALELHWATCASNMQNDYSHTLPGEPFLRIDTLRATSRWILLQPLIRKHARNPRHPTTTPEEFQHQHFRTCEELLAQTLQGRPSDLVDPSSLLAYLLNVRLTVDSPLLRLAASIDDPFILTTMISVAADQFTEDDFAKHLAPEATAEVKVSPPRLRQLILLAARQQDPKDDSALRLALVDRDADVRRLAVQWAAEEGFTDLSSHVDAVFQGGGMTIELFLAALAGQEMLDGKETARFDQGHSSQVVVSALKDESLPDSVRIQALRLVSSTDAALDNIFFAKLLRSENAEVQLEAVRTLQGASPIVSASLLREIASRHELSEIMQAEAIVGLAVVAKSDPADTVVRELLMSHLKRSNAPQLQREALRAVRPLIATDLRLRQAVLDISETLSNQTDQLIATELADQIGIAWINAHIEVPEHVQVRMSAKPADRDEWLGQLNRGRAVDIEAGRRLFYHPDGPACSKCHLANGRGGRIGPNLSQTIGSMNRIQLIQSLLEPSREIAPRYIPWTIETDAGLVVSGLLVREENGKTIIANAEGVLTELSTSEIANRIPQAVSIMPDKLHEHVTLQELRDLIAFLDTLR